MKVRASTSGRVGQQRVIALTGDFCVSMAHFVIAVKLAFSAPKSLTTASGTLFLFHSSGSYCDGHSVSLRDATKCSRYRSSPLLLPPLLCAFTFDCTCQKSIRTEHQRGEPVAARAISCHCCQGKEGEGRGNLLG